MKLISKFLLVFTLSISIFMPACKSDGEPDKKKDQSDKKYEKEIEENALEQVPDSI